MAKILIADDSKVMRDAVKTALNQAFPNPRTPFEFVEAQDGTEAYDFARSKGPFDLILTDQNMPGMTGLEFFKALTSPPPTVFVLDTANPAIRSELTDAKANGVIMKPFSVAAFKALAPFLGEKA